jgi:mannose-6-phosphate isomerase-like protein (cupin superfamily)
MTPRQAQNIQSEQRTTGRPLDPTGRVREGPSLSLDPDGPAAARLAAAPRPLASNPAGNTWATFLEGPAEGETERPRLLQWLAPDATAPPPHVHPTTETFTAVEGTVTVVRDGEGTALEPGATVRVDPGVAHTFRNDTDGVVAFEAALPSMRTVAALYTAWGRCHERAGATGDFTTPGPLEALVLSADVAPETTMTAVPTAIQRALWATLGRAARAVGQDGIEERYLANDFWRRHVEQPALAGPAEGC